MLGVIRGRHSIGTPKSAQSSGVPVAGREVHQRGARGRGDVGLEPPGQAVAEEGVGGAEPQPPRAPQRLGARRMLAQDPGELGRPRNRDRAAARPAPSVRASAPSARSRSVSRAVRSSCQTMTGPSGSPGRGVPGRGSSRPGWRGRRRPAALRAARVEAGAEVARAAPPGRARPSRAGIDLAVPQGQRPARARPPASSTKRARAGRALVDGEDGVHPASSAKRRPPRRRRRAGQRQRSRRSGSSVTLRPQTSAPSTRSASRPRAAPL